MRCARSAPRSSSARPTSIDHIYTVFGAVVAGMAIVDGILEGDVIQRVELVSR